MIPLIHSFVLAYRAGYNLMECGLIGLRFYGPRPILDLYNELILCHYTSDELLYFFNRDILNEFFNCDKNNPFSTYQS